MSDRAGAAAFLLLALAACTDSGQSDLGGYRPLLADLYSEERLLARRVVLDELTVDFREADALAEVRTRGLDSELRTDGLHIRPRGDDPILILDRPDRRFNMVEVEMATAAGGGLQVFWAGANQPFQGSRSKRVPLVASGRFKRYSVDLREELPPLSSGHRFRIDPIDAADDVTLRTLRLARVADLPPEGEGPHVGKVRLGGETRVAVALVPGSPLRKTLEIATGDALRFATASARDNTTPSRLELTARRASSAPRVLFERRFAAGESGDWQDVRLPLDDLAPGRWELELSVHAATDDGLATVLVASPAVVGATPGRRSPNVLLVSLDTLGASHALLDEEASTAPFVARLAREGAQLSNAFAASSITHVSHASLLTGREPLQAGIAWLRGSLRPGAAVAEAFRRAGYATAAFTGGVLVTESLGFDQGFELFYQHDTLHNRWPDQTDVTVLTERLGTWLRMHEASRPAFLFLHSYEIHGPFQRRDEHVSLSASAAASRLAAERHLNLDHMKGLRGTTLEKLGAWVQRLAPDERAAALTGEPFSAPDLDVARAYYRSEITYTDDVLRRLFEMLDGAGFLDDAVVVVTADHGEAFGEHGLLQHGLLYDENLHVPLVVWGPGRVPAGVRIETQVSSPDVAPTLLELAGLPIAEGMQGRSLAPLLRGEAGPDRAFGAFVPGNGFAWYSSSRRKLLLRASLVQESFGLVELFDLVRDPGETDNLLADGSPLPGSWRATVREAVTQLPGFHFLLGRLATGEHELEIGGPVGLDEILYAFELERLSAEPAAADGSSYRCRVRLRPESRLVLAGSEPAGPVVLSLRAAAGGPVRRFTLEPARLAADGGSLAAAEGDGVLPILRVAAEQDRGGLTEEETRRLVDLGYLE